MGRRSTKTTKTGKFMNPTDQWRKQCRKKELKKNKVQRTAVREAVIKNKNPQQLLAEIEEIEKMEIEAGTDELPSDKGLKEKKRKLHETLQRIVSYYEKEDYSKAQQIKTLVVESEKRRRDLTTIYSSYRSARSQYDVSEIPLPEGPSMEEDVAGIPLPEGEHSQGIVPRPILPPAPPPGPPPDIMYPKAITHSVHFSQSDEESDTSDSEEEEDSDNDIGDNEEEEPQDMPPRPPGPPPGLPPPGIHYAPPPLFPPPLQHGGFPLGPPLPPRPLPPPPNKPSPHFHSSPVISATPSAPPTTDSSKPQPIISAQPQIRNVAAEVTKFLPTSLRVRRDVPRQCKPGVATRLAPMTTPKTSNSNTTTKSITKGDAYDAFMQEMNGLL